MTSHPIDLGREAKPDAGAIGRVDQLEWSPDGRFIGFLASQRPPPVDDAHGVEVDVNWTGGAAAQLGSTIRMASLVVVDLRTRTTRVIPTPSLNVHSFAWSPDGTQIAVAASKGADWHTYMHTDLYTLDVATDRLRPLVVQEGPDHDPVWSPDGQWVAFKSQGGNVDWLQQTFPAAVRVRDTKTIYPTRPYTSELYGSPDAINWSPDSQALYIGLSHRLSRHLFRVPLSGAQSPTQITPDDGGYYSQFSFDRKYERAAFAIQRVTDPSEIAISPLSPFKPRILTRVNSTQADLAKPIVEDIQWRSQDDRWDIHGVLIKPPDYQPGRRYPLIVYLTSGPGMASRHYNLAAEYPLLVFAAKGYVVLAPNTRGRGGFGEAFAHAIGAERSYGPSPHRDMMAGVDMLISRGIADSEKLGVLGFSYGGYLAAYALTQTNRFRSASVSEGIIDVAHRALLRAGQPGSNALRDAMWGFGAPFDMAELEAMRVQSPLYGARHITTPVLLEYGQQSWAPTHGLLFFQALQHFGVTSEFVVYPRSGHGISEPVLKLDSMLRNLEWFDYWLLGRATDRLARRYGVRSPPHDSH